MNIRAEPANPTATADYAVIGMDCAHDAAEIEEAVAVVPGVATARVSAATHVLSVQGFATTADITTAVEALGYGLELRTDDETSATASAHTSAGYRRALWTVIALNVGYGVIEMIGGFLAGSQALKADALDFLGDGFITLLGLLAIGWSLLWRARAALLQGIFLGLLGLGILFNTAYRAIAMEQPQPEVMGSLGLVALLVNVGAAAVLIPHRKGDANVRAVWLFSRNDAIGNVAVVAAAGLVAWSGSPWPDLAVALVLAWLFAQSSRTIVRDSLEDLQGATRRARLNRHV